MQPFELIAIADVPEILEQKWLVKGLLPSFDEGSAGYIFGAPKTRKSLLLADLALSVATGTPALGLFNVNRVGAVVGFFAEDPRAESSRRIHRLARGRGVEVPHHLKLIKQNTIAVDDERDQERLMATLTGIPDLALVFLDPMVRLHSANENRAEEMAPIHTFLRVLSRSLPGVVVVLAHHSNKSDGARGSTEMTAFGDFNIYCRSADEQTTDVFKIENRGGPPGVPFHFHVDDGAVEAGATMRLVAETADTDDGSHEDVIVEALRKFRERNPRASGRDGLQQLRSLSLKVSSDRFWKLWGAGR